MTAVDDKCPHCGLCHRGPCPRVRSIEYHRNGTVKKVEYHDPLPQPRLPLGDDE
jgi:hypothetical protein